ncbi:MAG: c-type cytochrome biogenesis protein CcmI [Pseudomonadota bacterium]
MVFWLVALLITAAVAAPIVLAIAKAQDNSVSGAQSDMAVYKDQLAEVDRDLARGVLTEAEAQAARTEVSRRLLDADKRLSQEESKTALTRPAIVGVLLVLVAGGSAIYAQMGAPGYPDLPMAQRLADIADAAENRPGQLAAEADAAARRPEQPQGNDQYQTLMTQLRAAMEQRPGDLRGLQLLADNEARLGNFEAAREAQERILEIKGDEATVRDLQQTIDIMVFGAGGYVSPEAESLIRRLAELSPDNGAARYYSGLTLAQNGRPDLAFPIWQRLLDESRPDAPWMPVIQAQITGLAAAAGIANFTPPQNAPTGPSDADLAAAEDVSVEDRQAMIEGMVEGLAARLAAEGGPPDEWARLITALGVLGETDRAAAILAEARQVFGESDEALALFDNAAVRAGLE